MRKTNKQLLEIWNNKENSEQDYYIYQNLTTEEKARIFDILAKNQSQPKLKLPAKQNVIQ